MSKAGDYYNSLPLEQRKLLAPLLEEYRLMGLEWAQEELSETWSKINARRKQLKEGLKYLEDKNSSVAPSEEGRDHE